MTNLGRLWKRRTMRQVRRRRAEIETVLAGAELSDVERWMRYSVEPERRRREGT